MLTKYDDTVSSTLDGKPIYGAQVTVYNDDGVSPASIFADENATTPLTQPVLTDALGYFSFYISDGRYDLTIMSGLSEVARTNIVMVNSLELKQRAIIVPQNEAGGTIPPAGARAGKVLSFDPATGAPTVSPKSDFAGPPGGNVLSSGPKTAQDGIDVAAGAALLQTDSYNATATGGQAPYVKGRGTTDAIVTRHPRFTFRNAAGEAWEMPVREPTLWECGVYPDGTDVLAKVGAAIDWAWERGENSIFCPRVPVGGSSYYFSNTLHIDRPVNLRSPGGGKAASPNSQAVFQFARGVDGIVTHTYLTSPRNGEAGPGGFGGTVVPGEGAAGIIIDGLRIVGSADDSADIAALRMRVRSTFRNFNTVYFGDGVNITVENGGSGLAQGNANHWLVENFRADAGKGHGVNLARGDSNAGRLVHGDIAGFNGYAVRSNAFLSNTIQDVQALACGTFELRRSGTFAGVNQLIDGNLNFFVPHPYATSAQLAANEPSLNSPYWVREYLGPNPQFPVWQSGNPNYAPGGAGMFAGPCKAQNYYGESGQGAILVLSGATLEDGTWGCGAIAPPQVPGPGSINYTLGGARASRNGFIARMLDDYGSNTGRYAGVGLDLRASRYFQLFDPIMWPSEFNLRAINASEMAMMHGAAQFLRFNGSNHSRPDRMTIVNALLEYPAAADNTTAKAPVESGGLGLSVGDFYRNTTTHALTEVF